MTNLISRRLLAIVVFSTILLFPTRGETAAIPSAEVCLQLTLPLPQQRNELDLSGTWAGKLFQNKGGIAPEFELTMEIVHNGIFVRGTSYVIHEGIWAEMRFSGYQKENGAIAITETEILRAKKPDDLSWCMKEYELRAAYTPEGLVLSGPWWGDSIYGACIPGSVLLKRKVKTA